MTTLHTYSYEYRADNMGEEHHIHFGCHATMIGITGDLSHHCNSSRAWGTYRRIR
ncbi:MAG: hypothetical protein RIM23_28030 [Coleofasciculus sp. G3-WIS-01]|uniref:hypothetical protein n=1 Tax=Coleofasciculus sp. G3-WIS-01 TaxID=3069528 RepID=UPI0032F21559